MGRPASFSVIRFGVYELNPSSGELRKHGLRVRLDGQPIAILKALLDRPGELVSREELQKKLWPADTFVDFEHSLNAAVKRLRAALNDSAEHPRYIETLARRGYRFIAPIEDLTRAFGIGEVEHQPTEPHVAVLESPPQQAVRVPPRWLWLLTAAALCVAVLSGWAWRKWRHYTLLHTATVIRSVAVLPMQNLSGDPSQEYLADGLTEELIGRLANIPGLLVISRTSAMQFKGMHLPLPEIAGKLRVDAVLEGSVLREGSRIRIHAQLIRGSTDEHIWAEEYERDYRSVLGLQEDVARTIANKVELSLTTRPAADMAPARTIDPEAHEDYLKGLYYFNQRTVDASNKSIAYFQQAIRRDPSYALPYSGLADAYALLAFRGRFPSRDVLLQAKAAALKATALDNALSQPHTSLAFIAETQEWDWPTAEREYKRALQLNPGDARARHLYAGYLVYIGRFDDGIAEEQRARELDPLSLPVNNALAGRLMAAGRYDEALQQVKKTLELNDNFAPAHQTLGWIYLNGGKGDAAINEFQRARQLSGSSDTDLMLDLGFAYAKLHKQREAHTILEQLMKQHEQGLIPSGPIAILYGAMGDLDDAFAWLDKAYQERDPELTYINVPGRRFEPLRHDPRFRQLVRRIGLAQ